MLSPSLFEIGTKLREEPILLSAFGLQNRERRGSPPELMLVQTKPLKKFEMLQSWHHSREFTCAPGSVMLYSKPWHNPIQLLFRDSAALPTRSTGSFISAACWIRSGFMPREN